MDYIKEAEKFLSVFKADLLRGRLDLAENIGNKPFSTIVNLYIDYAKNNLKSSYTVIKIAEAFNRMWKNKLIIDITPELIENYKKKRLETVYYSRTTNNITKEKTIKPDTINRELGVLSKMFSLAIDNKYTKENPVSAVKKLKVENRLERHLSVEEEEKITKIDFQIKLFEKIQKSQPILFLSLF